MTEPVRLAAAHRLRRMRRPALVLGALGASQGRPDAWAGLGIGAQPVAQLLDLGGSGLAVRVALHQMFRPAVAHDCISGAN